MDNAEDAEDERSALIDLIVSRQREMGRSGRLASVLKGGGKEAAELVVSVLEHAVEMLDSVSSATPRKGRKAVRELLERLESVAETVDISWADGVSQCSEETLEELGGVLAAMREAEVSSADVMARAETLVGGVERCGSTVMQSVYS